MGLEDTAPPSAVVYKVGRLGGWGLGLAGPKRQEGQRDSPTPTERPVRIWSSPGQRLGATQSGQPREPAGRLGPWGGWQVSGDEVLLCLLGPPAYLQSPARCPDTGSTGAGPAGGPAGVTAERGEEMSGRVSLADTGARILILAHKINILF